MSRQRRINAPGTVHHVVNRGVDRQPIFFDDVDRVEFGRLLGEVHTRFGVEVIAYCLMDNHYHCIVRCADGHLSDAMQYLQSVFASHTNRRNGRDGHLFAKRFYSALITNDDYLLTAVRYVERNALSIFGVDDPVRYRWSSVRTRAGLRRAPEWFDGDIILDRFQTVDHYLEFVRRDRVTPTTAGLDPTRLCDAARLVTTLDLDDDVNTAQIDRTMVLALLPRLREDDARRIALHLGLTDARSVRQATWRAQKRVANVPSLRRAVERLEQTAVEFAGVHESLRPTG